jgi:hypothetical protein
MCDSGAISFLQKQVNELNRNLNLLYESTLMIFDNVVFTGTEYNMFRNLQADTVEFFYSDEGVNITLPLADTLSKVGGREGC